MFGSVLTSSRKRSCRVTTSGTVGDEASPPEGGGDAVVSEEPLSFPSGDHVDIILLMGSGGGPG